MVSHEKPLLDFMESVLEQKELPASQVEAQIMWDFINGVKAGVKDAESDIKDAKRRINANKPKKAKAQDVQAEDGTCSEGSESA